MSLTDTLRINRNEARKSGDKTKLSILTVVLGEIEPIEQKLNKPMTDEAVQTLLRKLVESNQTVMAAKTDPVEKATLQAEIAVLEAFIPKLLTFDELEAAFLNSDGPEMEQIAAAKSDGQATGIAMKFVKQKGLAVNGAMVNDLVKKLRSVEKV